MISPALGIKQRQVDGERDLAHVDKSSPHRPIFLRFRLKLMQI